jgi:hypothetical protein
MSFLNFHPRSRSSISSSSSSSSSNSSSSNRVASLTRDSLEYEKKPHVS